MVVPSPKFHCQEVGLPVDVSVNCTDCPTAGEAGSYAKEAASVGEPATVIVRRALLVPEPLWAVSATG